MVHESWESWGLSKSRKDVVEQNYSFSHLCWLTLPALSQSLQSLDDEEKSDKQLREQFKERWSRTPSQTLTKPMREEAKKYRTILDTAIQADKIVREKYEKNKDAITLLSKPHLSLLSLFGVGEGRRDVDSDIRWGMTLKLILQWSRRGVRAEHASRMQGHPAGTTREDGTSHRHCQILAGKPCGPGAEEVVSVIGVGFCCRLR